jgi:RNA polymerase sigma factor (sigma-70 family)
MFIPLLQKERSIDDFVDSSGEYRLSSLLTDENSENQVEELYIKEVAGLVQGALTDLDDRERHIIRNRFGLLGGAELTLEEIGKTLNLSRERVRQLERDAKNKIRQVLEGHEAYLKFSLA